jgi:methylmalonyl-CoA mutase
MTEKQPGQAQHPFALKHRVRVVTAASLFDGHDAAINIMRRLLQAQGAEVIHLGHDRAVRTIVDAAIQEDVQAIAISSYQGGHVEYFSYLKDLLDQRGSGHIRIYGGGGGVIAPDEIEALRSKGITRIYTPEDGQKLGLVGMIQDLLAGSDHPPGALTSRLPEGYSPDTPAAIARVLTTIEAAVDDERLDIGPLRESIESRATARELPPVIGFTGTGGAGKSSLVDEMLLRLLETFPSKRVAVLSVDPSRRRTGGALLGDRIRMNAVAASDRVFMRSMATRQANLSVSRAVKDSLAALRVAGFDLVVLETAGIGQSDSEVVDLTDTCVYVMTPEYGAPTQLEKIDMLDFAALVAINKFDKPGALDALRDVRKTMQRNRNAFDRKPESMPVFGTCAHRFHDPGTNSFFNALIARVSEVAPDKLAWRCTPLAEGAPDTAGLLPSDRRSYLSGISQMVRRYREQTSSLGAIAARADGLRRTLRELGDRVPDGCAPYADIAAGSPSATVKELRERYHRVLGELGADAAASIGSFEALRERYRAPTQSYEVRGKAIPVENATRSLSGLDIAKVALPEVDDWAGRLRYLRQENVPGRFPFTAGVFPFKRQNEDPTRMFAGEGTPERTNRRFHYLSSGQPATRLSTAFDSVTLYGNDPAERPDVYGKIGNSGVSVATLDDAKRLYSGFDLCKATTSVSMTINGPAPVILAFFFNAAIDAACERRLRASGRWSEVDERIGAWFGSRGLPRPVYRGDLPKGHDGSGLGFLGVSADRFVPTEEYESIRAEVLATVRGTVQADILKEDQAQNTCIFSTEFALRMMADVQSFFIAHQVRNFYSVSISGYHIAEAGANPITQLAFTLANGFTYVEYYRARGMAVDAFAPNLSFFFSNGLDPEYSVIGRVARRIWAIAMRDHYGASERSQMLKYHIQTSGRSLHAQEIAFNDIRTTLQALYAIADNCNSLHTNAYDEAITTPTEESVRRAMAIQLIINRELGLTRNENPMQGSFFQERLTDLVEDAVLEIFRALDSRGGVLGAMESMYQRSRIQDESMEYERRKASGELPIVGVNTFLDDKGESVRAKGELIRSTEAEKRLQIDEIADLRERFSGDAPQALAALKAAATSGGNLFAALMEAVKVCSLGQICGALYDVGGAYRRSM